ncbi:PD-(D/E)XK nuclease family protein [Candidatus Fermentibacterales bacterium]|nr:PD-(D/E)XK nuclease family protein [Candidatus Fermentibacterales bacterium]
MSGSHPVEVFEGHYRALERSLVERVLSSVGSGKAAPPVIVAAGRPQLERLAGLLSLESPGGVLTGVRLFPGFPQFASWAGHSPCRPVRPTAADMCSFALEAMRDLESGEPFHNLMSSASTAFSLSQLFERLLDRGIDSSAYVVASQTTRSGATPTERSVGKIFERYEALRRVAYPDTHDSVMSSLAASGRKERRGAALIYGYYDLNPGQRRLIRAMHSSGWELDFFTPLQASSEWAAGIGIRTRALIEELGCSARTRVDSSTPMSELGQFAESRLLGRTAAVPGGLELVECSGRLGQARAVLRQIEALGSERGIAMDSIAVVERTEASRSALAALAWHEGFPVNCPLEAPLADLPVSRLILGVLSMPDEDYHYTVLRSLAMTGCLTAGADPVPGGIDRIVEATGVRFGEAEWLALEGDDDAESGKLARLAGLISGLHRALPRSAPAREHLAVLEEHLGGMLLEPEMAGAVIAAEAMRSPRPVGTGELRAVLESHLRNTSIELRPADRRGFRILAPETVRGTLHRAVIVTGLEEGVFPEAVREDPRLSPDLRQKLQLTSPENRMAEETFLFRQVLEAASERVCLVFEKSDAMGSTKQRSLFLDMLDDPASGAGRLARRAPVGTAESLVGGSGPAQTAAAMALEGRVTRDRPFMARALDAETARLSATPFDEYDGCLGAGAVTPPARLSATALEDYAKCPFLYLVKHVWKLKERPGTSVAAEPDLRLRGRLLHRVIATILTTRGAAGASPGRVREVLEESCAAMRVEQALGSPALLECFIERQVRLTVGFLESIRHVPGDYTRSEVELEGTLGKVAMTGRLDLILTGPDGGCLVLDLKTGKPKDKAASRRLTLSGHLFQIPVYYALARQAGLGPRGAGYLYVARGLEWGGQPIFEGDEMDRLVDASAGWAERYRDLIAECYFPPLPGDKQVCRRCCYGALCRKTPGDRLSWRARDDDRARALRGEPGTEEGGDD